MFMNAPNSRRAPGGGEPVGRHSSFRGDLVRSRVPLLHRGAPADGGQAPSGRSRVDEEAVGRRGQP